MRPDDGSSFAAADAEAAAAAARDRAERAAATASVELRNAARLAEHARAVARFRARGRHLIVASGVVGTYEIVWWVVALRARSRAFDVRGLEERLPAIRSWTVAVGPHYVVTVVALALLAILWWRHLHRRPVEPLLELPLDDTRRRHPAFTQDAPVPRRIV